MKDESGAVGDFEDGPGGGGVGREGEDRVHARAFRCDDCGLGGAVFEVGVGLVVPVGVVPEGEDGLGVVGEREAGPRELGEEAGGVGFGALEGGAEAGRAEIDEEDFVAAEREGERYAALADGQPVDVGARGERWSRKCQTR